MITLVIANVIGFSIIVYSFAQRIFHGQKEMKTAIGVLSGVIVAVSAGIGLNSMLPKQPSFNNLNQITIDASKPINSIAHAKIKKIVINGQKATFTLAGGDKIHTIANFAEGDANLTIPAKVTLNIKTPDNWVPFKYRTTNKQAWVRLDNPPVLKSNNG